MENERLKKYVDDAIITLEQLSMSFRVIVENIEENDQNKKFIRSELNKTQSSFEEFKFIDNILIEYLCVNILSVIDPKQFSDKIKKENQIANYDILKLAKRISGKEKVVNAQTFTIKEFNRLYKCISHEKLLEIKALRDQHYSHIDRKRKNDTDILIKDVIEMTQLFLKVFDTIYKPIKGYSIYDRPINLKIFDMKLKAFKYDMMMQYLSKSTNPDLDKLKSMGSFSNFEDSYKALF